MQAKFLISAALFAALSTAQINNIDTAEAARAATALANYENSLVTNTRLHADLYALATAIPSSVIAAAEQNPASFAAALDTATIPPPWITALPTAAINSLETLLAPPFKAISDADALATAPFASSLFANAAIPSSVYASYTRDPVQFIYDLNTATTWPAWATAIPATLQTQIGQAINQQLSTFRANYESGFPSPTRSSAPATRSSAPGTAPFPTRNPSASASGACPTCPSCASVTVTVTVTSGSPSASIPTSNNPKLTLPALTSVRASTGRSSRPSVVASTGLPRPSLATSALPRPSLASTGVPRPSVPVVRASPSGTRVASSGVAVLSGSGTGAPITFNGGAVRVGRGRGFVGMAVVVGVGVGVLMGV